MMEDNVLIETDNLMIGYVSVRSKKLVAGPLNLKVSNGELICLLGPNGSGKSTLLRTLSGLQLPIAGEVMLSGNLIRSLKSTGIARKISLVLSDKIVGSNLDVYSLIALGRYPYTGLFGILSEEDKRIIHWAAEVTDTLSFFNRKLDSLSDGECQKVMLARAIAQDTPVVILDEPTAHLDLPSRLKLMQLLSRLARDTGKAILLSTHELDLALQVADIIWLLDGRGAISVGVPEQLVLDGVFQKAFDSDNIKFDPNTGHFAIPHLYEKKLFLEGEGLRFIWTKKALERSGFLVLTTTDKSVNNCWKVIIKEPNWILSINGQKEYIYASLPDLIVGLGEIEVPDF